MVVNPLVAAIIAIVLIAGINRCGKPNIGALLSGWKCKVRMTTPDTKPRDVVVLDAEILSCLDKQGRQITLP